MFLQSVSGVFADVHSRQCILSSVCPAVNFFSCLFGEDVRTFDFKWLRCAIETTHCFLMSNLVSVAGVNTW